MSQKQQSEIEILRFPDNVRKHHGMYILTLNNALEEIVANSVDEVVAGNCNKIDISIKEDVFTVTDNGSGIPIIPSADPEFNGIPQVEVAMSTLHASGKFGGEKSYNSSTAGQHGVGASCVNALSEEFSVIVKTGGAAYRCDFEKGIIKKHLYKLKDKVSKEDTGTTVIYRPDYEIWGDEWVDFKAIERRCRQLAYLNPGLEINLVIDSIDDEENPIKAEHHFQYNEGIVGYVKKLTQGKSLIGNVIEIHSASKVSIPPGDTDNNKLVDGLGLDIAFAWNDSYSNDIKSFVNNVRTVYGGDHELGFREGLVKAIKRYAVEYKFIKDQKQIEAGDCLEGLTVVLSTRIKDPVYEGQGKGKLKSTQVRGEIRDKVDSEFYDYLCQDSKRSKEFIEKYLKAGKARLAAKRARDAARGLKEVNNVSNVLGKLANCSSKNPDECEVFFVEGKPLNCPR